MHERKSQSSKAGRAYRQSGFTLIEMLVSIALFAIVMVVCVGALLALVGANKKAQALESAINNLNISLDTMVRNAREGTNFHCGGGTINTPQDCQTGGTEFAFEPYGGNSGTNDQWVYQFVCPSGLVGGVCPSGGYIQRSKNSGGIWSTVTSPEVSVTSMTFYVVGTAPASTGDLNQPRVIITIDGIAGGGLVKDSTTFHLQATAVQRSLDL